MIKYINDKSRFPQSVDELDGHLLDFEGHDRPRYVYPANAEAGYIGLDDWGQYWNKPSFKEESTGALDETKFYSIVVVPIKGDISVAGMPIYGEATAPSIPVQPTAALKSLIFNIPTHEQTVIKACGYASLSTEDYLQDEDATWTEDEFTGYLLKNVDTGKVTTIYRNTLKRLFAYGVDFTAGDRYQLLKKTVTSRLIYAAEMAPESDVTTSDYYLRGVVGDNTTQTYEMAAFAESGDIWDFDAGYLQPPNANCVKVVSGIMFCGGGIAEETGKAHYEGTLEEKQATSTADEQIAVTVVDDDYDSSGTSQIVRLTLGDDLAGFDKAVVGSYVTITGSEDSGNDVEDARVLRVNDEELEATEPDGTSELYVGTFNGASTYVDGVKSFINTGPYTFTLHGYFYKLGTAQYIFGSEAGRTYLSISSSNVITFTTTTTADPKITTIAANQWSDGLQTWEFFWEQGQKIIMKINGSLVTSSGGGADVNAETKRWLIGKTKAGFGGTVYYWAGRMLSFKFEDSAVAANSFFYKFDAGSGTVIEDLTNSNDGVLYDSTPSTFWDNTVFEDLNVGDGAPTTPVLTALAREDLWRLECIQDGPDAVFSVTGNIEGPQENLTTEVPYSNDFFSMEISDGATPWAVGDFFVFNVIKSEVTDKRWIEILNNDGVANADDETMKIVLTPNYIQGNASGADKTLFSEGMVDANFQFPADRSAPYIVSWADPVNQRLGLASKYSGLNSGTDAALKILSDYSLYYSDSRNPHRVRTGAIIDIGDSITGISSVGDNVMVFCKNSLWRVPIESLGTQPVLISDNVRCPAQFSIARGEKYILFYDGTGFSVTDGVTVTSVTAYKASDYLKNINKVYEKNIQGVYDRENKRFEFVFPMGTETLNNYGMYITEGSWSCFPFSRPDCNALWTNYDQGNLRVYHGTTGSASDGDGDIWKHEGLTDGLPTTGAYLFTISSIVDQTVTVASEDGDTGLAVGDVVTVYPIATGGAYKQMIVKTVTKTSADPAPATYSLTFDSIYDLSEYGEGDLIFFGLIPFDYGVKWTDFSSPQYRHQVRNLHLDIEGAYGLIYVDHYTDMNPNPVASSGYSVYPNTTKLVIPFRGGKCYKYGFRLRGVSLQQIRISAFEIIFDTQI